MRKDTSGADQLVLVYGNGQHDCYPFMKRDTLEDQTPLKHRLERSLSEYKIRMLSPLSAMDVATSRDMFPNDNMVTSREPWL